MASHTNRTSSNTSASNLAVAVVRHAERADTWLNVGYVMLELLFAIFVYLFFAPMAQFFMRIGWKWASFKHRFRLALVYNSVYIYMYTWIYRAHPLKSPERFRRIGFFSFAGHVFRTGHTRHVTDQQRYSQGFKSFSSSNLPVSGPIGNFCFGAPEVIL